MDVAGSETGLAAPCRALFAPVAAFALLILMFFYPSLFLGQSVYDVDLRYVESPMKWFLFQREGRALFPLWTRSLGCGYPIHAYGEGGLCYPLNWAVYPFVPIPFAHDVTLMVHLLIGGAGMIMLAKTNRQSSASGLASGLAFLFSGHMLSHLGHVNGVQILAWAPWTYCTLHWIEARTRFWHVPVLSGLIAMMFLAGRPQIAFFTWVGMGFWVCLEGLLHRKAGPFAAFAFASLCGLMIASPQLIPTWEFARISDRAQGLSLASQLTGTVRPGQLLWMVLPLWRPEDTVAVSSESISYIGIVAGVCLVASLLEYRTKKIWPWWMLLLFSMLLAMGEALPWNRWIYQLPGFSFFRTPARWLVVSCFAAAVLCGMGVDVLLARWKDKVSAAVLGPAVITLMVVDLFVFAHPLTGFLERRVQNQTPLLHERLQGDGRYLMVSDKAAIFLHEMQANGIPVEQRRYYFRVREMLDDNLGLRYGPASLGSYTGMKVRWYAPLLERLTQARLDSMHCRWIISDRIFTGFSFLEIASSPFYHVYENRHVLPRARLVSRDRDMLMPMQGVAHILPSDNHQEVAVDVDAPQAGYLLLADTYYPGWKVLVNESQRSVQRVDGWMRSVAVPQGKSTVRFTYEPASFAMGWMIGGLGILCNLAYCLARCFRKSG